MLDADFAALGKLTHGWNGYNAAPPSPDAINAARNALSACVAAGFTPIRVLASAESGAVMLCGGGSGYEVNLEVYGEGSYCTCVRYAERRRIIESDNLGKMIKWMLTAATHASIVHKLSFAPHIACVAQVARSFQDRPQEVAPCDPVFNAPRPIHGDKEWVHGGLTGMFWASVDLSGPDSTRHLLNLFQMGATLIEFVGDLEVKEFAQDVRAQYPGEDIDVTLAEWQEMYIAQKLRGRV